MSDFTCTKSDGCIVIKQFGEVNGCSIVLLQGGLMQGVQSTRRFSPQTKTRHAGNKGASSPKTPKENVLVEKAKLPLSGYKLSVTELKNLPTPIGLYEDECAFCHSFRTSDFHGPMEQYLNGRILSSDEGNPSNGIYVHRKCLEWAPKVWFEGEIAVNLESEIRRASRLRCHRCELPGAALGCYYEACKKSFHVPCALQIHGCRWDVDGRLVLCPEHVLKSFKKEHVSKPLPCDKLSSQKKKGDKFPSLPRSQCSHKEESFTTFQGEGQPMDQPHTQRFVLPSWWGSQQTVKINASSSSSSLLSQYSHKEALSAHSSRESRQMDQLITSSSSTRLRCYPDEEGISNACHGKEMNGDQQETSSYSSDKWVLLGSSLSASEKDSLENFACRTKATVTNGWAENVTHVIVGKYTGSAWSRSYEVLMAVLFGKWIVRAEWIVNCSEMRPDLEDSYEVTFSDDSCRPLDGPKKGRTRVAEGAPKLFSGLHFCLSTYMNPYDRGHMRGLIAAAGGRLLEGISNLHHLRREDPFVKPYFVYDGGNSGEFSAWTLRKEAEEGREHAAAGARVISHLKVLDAVAAYDAGVLDQKGRIAT